LSIFIPNSIFTTKQMEWSFWNINRITYFQFTLPTVPYSNYNKIQPLYSAVHNRLLHSLCNSPTSFPEANSLWPCFYLMQQGQVILTLVSSFAPSTWAVPQTAQGHLPHITQVSAQAMPHHCD
jgi:hypothetical protein